MFELLQAYETATHEKNKVFRFVYTKYVRHKLKTVFFKKFKNSIYSIELDKNLIEEFKQFYSCTYDVAHYLIPRADAPSIRPYVDYITGKGTIYVHYDKYRIKYAFLDDSCDIEIDTKYGKESALLVHPENDIFYESFYSEILIIAIYNYCVSYIYGSKSKLFIEDDTYMKNLRVVYL